MRLKEYKPDEMDLIDKLQNVSGINSGRGTYTGKELCPLDFRGLVNLYSNESVAIEYECAGCYKKATGILKSMGEDYILLTQSDDGQMVLVETLCPGMKEPSIRSVCQAGIQFKSLISIELLPNE